MQITVEFFGVLRSLAGTDQTSLTLNPNARVADACARLSERYPDLAARLNATACAIGDSLVARSALLADGARLALIPPVSGG
jgi:molybdopterin synthase catalytic subunit